MRKIKGSLAHPIAAAACLCVGALAVPQAARADTVSLSFVGNGTGRNVHVSLGAQSWDTFAGRLIHHRSNGTASLNGPPQNIVTFCTDLLQNHTATPATYNSSSVATLSGNGGTTNLGFAKQQAIYDMFAAAAGRQYTLGQDYASAFQIAVWEVVYNFSPTAPNHGLDVTSGTFHVTQQGGAALSSSMMNVINSLFASIGHANGTNGHLLGLQSTPYQDQLFDTRDGFVVPLPASFWPGMAGLGTAVLVTWRKKRQ
jgi:hypothetical protein